MSDVLAGVKVVEVSTYVMAPSACAVLAQWGADVVKVEHPVTGDPLLGHGGGRSPEEGWRLYQPVNLGKRSIGLDLKTADGLEVLTSLVRDADVFVTNQLPHVRDKLGTNVTELRKINPGLIYASASAWGTRGAESARKGFDAAAFWARSGLQSALSEGVSDVPVLQRGGFGDIVGAPVLAGAIAAALYKRAVTGKPSEVDVSLLGLGVWTMGLELEPSTDTRAERKRLERTRHTIDNPLMVQHRTSDDRWIHLHIMTEQDFQLMCSAIGRDDLPLDRRFVDFAGRSANRLELYAELDRTFASQTLEQWKRQLEGFMGAWSAVQLPSELLTDPQVAANGFVSTVEDPDGTERALPVNPTQFDGTSAELRRAPLLSEHADEILRELGRTDGEIERLRSTGVVR